MYENATWYRYKFATSQWKTSIFRLFYFICICTILNRIYYSVSPFPDILCYSYHRISDSRAKSYFVMVTIVPAALALTMVSIRSKLMLQEIYLICIKLMIYNDTSTLYFLLHETRAQLSPLLWSFGGTFPHLISFRHLIRILRQWGCWLSVGGCTGVSMRVL